MDFLEIHVVFLFYKKVVKALSFFMNLCYNVIGYKEAKKDNKILEIKGLFLNTNYLLLSLHKIR